MLVVTWTGCMAFNFVTCIEHLLDMTELKNSADLIESMLTTYQRIGWWVSLKIHFLHSNGDIYPICIS